MTKDRKQYLHQYYLKHKQRHYQQMQCYHQKHPDYNHKYYFNKIKPLKNRITHLVKENKILKKRLKERRINNG